MKGPRAEQAGRAAVRLSEAKKAVDEAEKAIEDLEKRLRSMFQIALPEERNRILRRQAFLKRLMELGFPGPGTVECTSGGVEQSVQWVTAEELATAADRLSEALEEATAAAQQASEYGIHL